MSDKADKKERKTAKTADAPNPIVATVSDDIGHEARVRDVRRYGIIAAGGLLLVMIIVGLVIAGHEGVFDSAKNKQYKQQQKARVVQLKVDTSLDPISRGDYQTAEENMKNLGKEDPSLLNDVNYNLNLFLVCEFNNDKSCMHTSAKQLVKVAGSDKSYQKGLFSNQLTDIYNYSK